MSLLTLKKPKHCPAKTVVNNWSIPSKDKPLHNTEPNREQLPGGGHVVIQVYLKEDLANTMGSQQEANYLIKERWETFTK